MFGYVAGEIPAGAGMGAMLKGIATARKLSANAVKGSKLAKSKTGRAIVASTPVQKGLRFVENIEKGFLKSLEKAGATSRFFINQSNKVYKTVVADVGGGLIKKTVRVTSGQVPVRLSMAINDWSKFTVWLKR